MYIAKHIECLVVVDDDNDDEFVAPKNNIINLNIRAMLNFLSSFAFKWMFAKRAQIYLVTDLVWREQNLR